MSASEQQRSTLADVARRAGVSASTASLAFSGAGPVSAATREKVMAAALDLGYSGPDPRARSLRQGRSGVVGIVFDERLLFAFRDPVNIATLDGIATGLGVDSTGLLLLTETGAVGPGIQSAAIDAAVLMGCSPVLDRVALSLRQRGVPLVSIEGGALDGVVDVALDNVDSAERIARHLHDLGHRRVGAITLATDVARETAPITSEREAAITTAVTRDRLAGSRRVFPSLRAYSAGYNLVEDGARAARALLEVAPDARPTAIMAQSDLLAVGALQAADELGLAVPEELSVTGFDGVRIEGLTSHDLTTMVQPAAEKGRAAGVAVTELLAGAEVASVRFECEFHVGDTTGPVPPPDDRDFSITS
ncbi:LacI family DNA-binding transcriptional regulator [Herbiconiux ginsengi]|uniref:Transcriptional regulator, LacI family n=1 Tax=Herbiconiux ginsengi TaxID=381665 RepID=A0A1H3M3Z1_9MICO|nr:LacI family DNA-binding transcriptional regulator [Herbiconiux ginsengi]SDY71014.1 transcriptional regulator, LacI family [Herbiconiux ginsengi]